MTNRSTNEHIAHVDGFARNTQIDVDHQRSEDLDSALGDELAESTISLRSSLYEGVFENGRTYHKYKQGKYMLPNDDAENDRLDLQHQLFLMTVKQSLFLAPVSPDIKHALDIGTGTGIWALEFAQEFPGCQVVGVDLSPTLVSLVPPNCHFEIDDVEEPWTWRQKWDYIHCRAMCSAFASWPKFFEQAFENMSPGGWIEMQDLDFPPRCDDGTLTPETALFRWGETMLRAIRAMGHELVTRKHKQLMIDAGFVDVTEVKYLWPQNTWPTDPELKELGRWHLVNSLEGLEGFSIALMTRFLSMSSKEAELFLVDVGTDMKDRRIHAYWTIYFVYGRKPEDKPS